MICEVFPLATCDTDCNKRVRLKVIDLTRQGSGSRRVMAVHTHPGSPR